MWDSVLITQLWLEMKQRFSVEMSDRSVASRLSLGYPDTF